MMMMMNKKAIYIHEHVLNMRGVFTFDEKQLKMYKTNKRHSHSFHCNNNSCDTEKMGKKSYFFSLFTTKT